MPSSTPPALRPWQRLSVRLAALFAAVTVLAVGLVGGLVYERQRRELEETVGTQLLNIARTGALLVDPALHAEARRALDRSSKAYRRTQAALSAIREATVLLTPVYTLTDYDPARRRARRIVSSEADGPPGEFYPIAPEVAEPLGWTFADGFARYTGIYRNAGGTWITAFAPIPDGTGRTAAVLTVDYPVEIYLDRLDGLRRAVVRGSLLGGLGALVLGLAFARRVTRPVSALTRGAARVAAGDLSGELPVRSSDELGRLTRAFNDMVHGLRQRDFIRNTFGRYVSPEVAAALLDAPDGLRLGGEKRVVTILMSDLRGYTRFAEAGDPTVVMEALNHYLARMTDVIVAHGGTVNEFIGDAVLALFGAPLPHADHAERAAAAALAMQATMETLNAEQEQRGLPRFEMGIGLNTGEAVVGNVGSEQRAKYTVIGNAVNTAARIESATVGGQVLLSAATYEAIRGLADVAPPLAAEVKGLSEPLLLYELRALRGRFARSLPADAEAPGVDVVLPATAWLIEGKTIGRDAIAGTVLRVEDRRLEARFETAVPLLSNVRVRVQYPSGRGSNDLYGKVIAATTRREGAELVRIHLTSVDPADRREIDALLGALPS